ncbi:Gfo/Idh/MocA family protein [Salisediminibacterium selenitireducens]|uniref:Oxidoreductase domain protein n=1 Tax=Bacillus selenitireducens (strain ATCC 700615 / DSM 15326 / MLS10) TaxID=439292 RepID=D6XYD7_BACIE|nr:Gfo/Idh/MocA family oxidoreductase [Salisediminibacterium selenitireducens]ADI00206.1 oxidoreductase domain protein [[Bacillus] selenitireducens MLS10]
MKIGTIGTGRIVGLTLDALRQIPDAECTAMYTRKRERASAYADNYGIDQIYTELDAFFASERFDTVYIASPNSLHSDHMTRALHAGKHVICEKPFTPTVKEAKAVKELAASKGLMVFEAISIIHMPNFTALTEALPKIGKVKLIQCNYSQYSSRYDALLAGETPNVFNPEFAGGALADINIYNLHFVVRLFGSPQSLTYTANRHSNGIDTSGVLVMTYDDHIAVCTGAKDTRSMNVAMIQGEKGYIQVVNGVNGMASLIVDTGGDPVTVNHQTKENRLYDEFRAFASIINNRDHAACQELLDHSMMVMETFEAARKSGGIIYPSDSE